MHQESENKNAQLRTKVLYKTIHEAILSARIFCVQLPLSYGPILIYIVSLIDYGH